MKKYTQSQKQKMMASAHCIGIAQTVCKYSVGRNTLRCWLYPEEAKAAAERHVRYDKANKAKRNAQQTAWRHAHPGKQQEYNRRLRATNPVYRIAENLRRRLRDFVKGRSLRTKEIVGCSWPQLKRHIEKQFQSNMSWGNYGKGGWDIDHIIPCASFDLTDPIQQRECFHFTNLQPLWHILNASKGKTPGLTQFI